MLRVLSGGVVGLLKASRWKRSLLSACLDYRFRLPARNWHSLSKDVSNQPRAIEREGDLARFPTNCNVNGSDPHDCFTSTPAARNTQIVVVRRRLDERRSLL
jgi:hypothetical protein